MKINPLLPLLCVAFAGAVSAYNLSGTVMDASGHGIAGVWVGLAQAKIATKTSSDGSWSLNGISGIELRSSAKRTAITNHLVLDGGRLKLSLSGMDIAGRKIPAVRPMAIGAGVARATVNVMDTLFIAGKGDLYAALPLSGATQSRITTIVDTSSKFAYRTSGDTLFVTNRPYLNVGCEFNDADPNASSLYYLTGGPSIDTSIYTLTASGIELTRDTGDYRSVTKFSRHSGSNDSLPGAYFSAGEVYRPGAGVSVPDSIQRIIAEDSVVSMAQLSSYLSGALVISTDTITQTFHLVASPGSAFLFTWNSTFYHWYYENAKWINSAGYSDSAYYDVTTTLLDSNTVRLVGKKTQETVTIQGVRAPNGWGYDYTYSSSNPSHPTAKSEYMPTTCLNGPTWLPSFKSDNFRTTSAARKLARNPVGRPVRRSSFLVP